MVKCERNFLSEKMLKSKKNNCLRSFEIKDFSVKHEKTKNSPLASWRDVGDIATDVGKKWSVLNFVI